MTNRGNLQRRVLILLVAGMTVVLVLSAYLHALVTRRLIEEDRYSAAVTRTVAIGARIASRDLLSKRDALSRSLTLLGDPYKDFEQIDVVEDSASGRELAATTQPAAARLPVLDEHTSDNELREMERPAQDIVTMEVLRHGARYWLMSMAIHSPTASGYVTALVFKNSYNPLVEQLQFQHNLILVGAGAVWIALCGWLFATYFRRPAREIVQAMDRTRRGDFDSRVMVRRNDELGEIGHGFNLLMEDLSARDREREALLARISGFNVELRAEVHRATAELQVTNQELLQAQDRLSRAARLVAVGQVAASLAHEIGTPLNSISGHLHLLGRRFPNDPETQRRVAIVNQQLESIVGSVRALLRRTHPNRSALGPLDLIALIGDLLRLVGPTLDNHRIVVATALAAGLPPVLADRDSLHQVLMNVINNSIDAMPDGGRLSIETAINQHDGHAEIVIRDSGPGIDPQALEHLFEPMWTTKKTGTGFGLAIARGIMTEHGGGIEAEAAGPGACFRLWIPLISTTAATA